MARATPTANSTSTGLSRESIVDAAAELFASDGFDAVTMRRLAERLGVGAMTLYGYFNTKEELLAALADRALDEVELPDRGLPWRERIAEVFRSVRRTFLEHPELAQIVATQPIDGVAAYRGAEVVFGALEEAGLDDRDAVATFDTLTAYATGFVLRETARGSSAAQVGERLEWMRSLPQDEFSHVTAFAGMLAARDPDDHFEWGLAITIGGIATLGEDAG